tara:strand:+ start:2373 stop:3698 length:1326 start_codon:yes stop_codon:yes gene_type:complete
MSKLFCMVFSLKNNIIIYIFFISLILFGCETTQIQTKTNVIGTHQNKENISKKSETKIEQPTSKIDSDNIPDVAEEVIKVGLLLPITGKHYQIGNSLLNASQLALEKTQEKNIKFIIRDTGNEDNITKNFYNLLNEDVDIILGPVFSKNILKIKPLAKDENIQIITFSNNKKIAQKNIYIFGLTLEDEIKFILEHSKKLNNKKLAAILPNNEYGIRIKNEIIKFINNNSTQFVKTIMYDSNNPDFYEVSKDISDYEQRNIELGLKIKELESLDTEQSRKELRRLKNLDTYGDLPFDSLFIGVENFKQLSMISSILPYYDVDPKKIQYLGNSVWNKDSIIKEPGLNNSLFTSIDNDSSKKFRNEYINIFNKKPHSIASLAYDAVGLIINLNKNNYPINASSLTSKKGFIGINGKFKFLISGNIERVPNIYRVKNEKLYKVNN